MKLREIGNMKTKLIFTTILTALTFNCQAGGGGLNLSLDDKLFIFVAGGSSKLDIDASLAPNTVLAQGALMTQEMI